MRNDARTRWIRAYSTLEQQLKPLIDYENEDLYFKCMICMEHYPRNDSDHATIGAFWDNWQCKFPDCTHSVCYCCFVRQLRDVTMEVKWLSTNVTGVGFRCPICRPKKMYVMTIAEHVAVEEDILYEALPSVHPLHVLTAATDPATDENTDTITDDDDLIEIDDFSDRS